eukprot:scaffold124913_cov21-Tisochrysis_lutea.AAC.1
MKTRVHVKLGVTQRRPADIRQRVRAGLLLTAGEQRMPAQSMSDPQRASDEHIDRVIPTGELRIPAQSMSDSLSVGDA